MSQNSDFGVKDAIQCEEPGCEEMATYDRNEWPPKKKKDNLIVAYVCPNEHRFIIEYPLKLKG